MKKIFAGLFLAVVIMMFYQPVFAEENVEKSEVIKIEQVMHSDNWISFYITLEDENDMVLESTCKVNNEELVQFGTDNHVLNFYSLSSEAFKDDVLHITLWCKTISGKEANETLSLESKDLSNEGIVLNQEYQFENNVTLVLKNLVIEGDSVFLYCKCTVPSVDTTYYLQGQDELGNPLKFILQSIDENMTLFKLDNESTWSSDAKEIQLQLYSQKSLDEQVVGSEEKGGFYAENSFSEKAEVSKVGTPFKIKIGK